MQSVFQFIPKVFSGVEVRALSRTLEFFHSNFGKPCLHGARFVYRSIVMLEQCETPFVYDRGNPVSWAPPSWTGSLPPPAQRKLQIRSESSRREINTTAPGEHFICV
ncbi:hypothetical protein PGIGA_G00167270 [Pangasianodon gigas]|uniref:Uncharacterized protein n=1 Tax=Pangasianodon gigas TaxID=30993 RepID=A0ACC5XT27_PANGG|nr:hypothetical protein [Pangasianodon gigas]